MIKETDQQQEEIQTVGAMLREARLKAGKSEDDIAGELCIRKVYVTAIEEMDYANIPPRPFGIGFIRAYAEAVGLNSDRIVSSYQQSFHESKEEKISERVANTSSSKPRFKHIFFGICGLAALFVIWSVLPLSEPVEDFQEDVADVIPEPVIVAEETATDENVNTEESVDAEEPDEIENTEEVIEVDDEQPAETLQDIVAEIDNDEPEAEVEETVAEVVEEAPEEAEETATQFHKMRMVLNGPSWVEIKKGDKTVLRGSVYKRGFSYDIPQEEGLTITVGRPRSATFYVDDKPVKVVSVMNSKHVSLDSFLIKTNN